MTKRNYHTHTSRCKHATGTDDAYVLAAVKAGFETLGFADHGPLPYEDGYESGIRMDAAALSAYLASVQRLRTEYAGRVEVRCGLEYEYFPAFMPYISDLLASGAIAYAILGNHFDLDERTGFYFGRCTRPEHATLYVRRTIEGMETGKFAYLAHPDLFLHSYPTFDDAARQASVQLCKAARDLAMPLEYNLLGLEKQRDGVPGLGYPCLRFWEIAAQEGCTAIIGVDAHAPEALEGADYAAAHGVLNALGIAIVDTI